MENAEYFSVMIFIDIEKKENIFSDLILKNRLFIILALSEH